MKPDKKFWLKKRVFITGHSGFKGTWVYLWLKLLGANVKGYSIDCGFKPKIFKSIFRDHYINQTFLDVRNYDILKKSLISFQPEIIIHMAAQPLVLKSYERPKETFSTNIVGTFNILDSALKLKNLKSICVITTDKCYQDSNFNRPFNENDRLGGSDPYSASKVAAEIITSSYFESFYKKKNISVFTVRAGNVIGGGDWSENRIIPDIIKAYFNKNKAIIRNPYHTRPWQHVLDPLNGYLLLIERSFVELIYDGWNFGPSSKNEINVKSLAEICNQIISPDYNMLRILKTNTDFYESKYLKLDSSKIKKIIGWKNSLDINKSIKWSLDWYLDRKNDYKTKTLNQIIDFSSL